MKVIDVHTHAFPDFLAEKAIQTLRGSYDNVHKIYTDGTVGGLLRSMDNAGVDIAVIASIATAEKQMLNIIKWSTEIRSERIIPFASVHPYSPEAVPMVTRIAEAGLKGIKLHPLYQDFMPLDPRAIAVYEAMASHNLVALFHSGDDSAYPNDYRCIPHEMVKIKQRVPGLKMILGHLGGYRQAADFIEHGAGSGVYIDTSLPVSAEVGLEQFRKIINDNRGKAMFASDCPWADQKATLELVKAAISDKKLLEDVLWNNAAKLLGLK